jgi:hypothetical protein
MMTRTCAALAVLLWSGAAWADLPAEVETVRAENAAACRDAGGNPVETESYIQQRDLNGDGQADVVMNLMGLTCEGAYSYFCGSAGCPVTVWTSGPTGLAVAWSNYAQDVTWDGATMVAYLHGQFCTPPRTGSEGCEERVSFDSAGAAPAQPPSDEPAAASPPPEAPSPDRWQLRSGGDGTSVAVVGGPGPLNSLAAFCLGGQPWLALLLTPPPATDDIRVDFAFSGGDIGGPAQRQPTTGGAFVIGLANNPLPGLLAGRDSAVGVSVEGENVGRVSLTGSTRTLRTALGPCLKF